MCSQYNRNKLHSTNINIKFVQQGKNTFLVSVVNSYNVFTLHSQLYNQLYEHNQNAYDLCGQGGCVDSRRCGAFDQNDFKIFIFLPSVAYDPRDDKIRSITKLYKNCTLFMYSLYEYSKRFD